MKKLFLLLMLLIPTAMAAQTAAINGYCTLGAVNVMTSGLPSSDKVQGLIPQCQVEVFLTGTTNLATLSSNATGTPLTNPFTADTKGKWLFWVLENQGYDVVMSGGIPPLTYPAPVTLTDLQVGGGGGGSFFAYVNGTLVSMPGSANFINSSSVTVTNPSTNEVQFTVVGTGPVVQVNGTPLITASPVNFVNDSTVAFTNPSAGVINATVLSAPLGLENLIPLPTPPAQQYVLYATACTQTNGGNVNGTISSVPGYCDDSSGLTGMPPNSGGIFLSDGILNWSGYTLPSFISQGNITAVYAVLTSSLLGGPGAGGGGGNYNILCSDGGINNTGQMLNPMTPYTSMTNVVAFSGIPIIATTTCQYLVNRSLTSLTTTWANVPLIGLIIDYTGSAPPVDNNFKIAPPLYLNASTNILGLTPLSSITPNTVAQLPTTGTDTWPLPPGEIQLVSDGSTTSGTCTAGGTILEWCQWTGSAWTVFSSGGSSLNVQTGGTPNTDQTALNFVNPSSFNGLSFAWSNPTGGNETFGISGALTGAGLASTTVTPGSYTNANITVNAAGQLTAASNGSGGGSGCTVSGPAFSIQIANSGVTGCTSDPNILIDTAAHAIDIGGTVPTNHFNLTNLSTITSPWTFDVTSPGTAINSILILTTTGTSGAATLSAGGTLNVPQYSGSGSFMPLAGGVMTGPLGTNTEYSNGTCTTAVTINPANGNRQKVTLTNADTCALTFTQPGSGTISITLKIIQSSAGSFNGTISGGKWPGGTVPTITATSGAIDFISCYLDGTNPYCIASQNFQ